MDFNYANVEYGFIKKYFIDASNMDAVMLNFDILKIHEGDEWMSMNSLILLDQSREKTFHIKYLVDSTSQYININLVVEGKTYFDETFDVDSPINHLELSWEGREVQIEAENFEFAMGVPFDINMIGNAISSLEVINSIQQFRNE